MYTHLLICVLSCTLVISLDQSYDTFKYTSTSKEENSAEDDQKSDETNKTPTTATSYSNVVIHTPQHVASTRTSEDMMSAEMAPLKIHFKRPQQSYRTPAYQSAPLTSVPDVHPAVMQKLLKQQPQTFDYQSDNTETDESQFGRVKPTGFRNSMESDHSDEDLARDNDQRSHKFRYIRYSKNNDKGFRYSSNSLPGIDKPSSFKVGYSIGFGNQNGHMRPHSMHTPTSFHMEGKNSVWKQLAPGVEMSEQLGQSRFPSEQLGQSRFPSEQIGQTRFPYKMYSNSHKQSPENQFYFMKDNVDMPTAGRMTFDHEHALGQSNSFDFTNAIDPSSGTHIALPNEERQYGSNYHTQEHGSREPKYMHTMPNQNTYTQPKVGINLNLYQANPNQQNRPDKVFPLGQNIYAGNFGYSSYPLIQQMYIQGKNGNGQMIPALLIPIQGANTQGMFMKYNFGAQPYFAQDPVPLGTNRHHSFARNQFFPQNMFISQGNRLSLPVGQLPVALQHPMGNPIALPLVMNPNHQDINRYQRDSDAESSNVMMKSDDVYSGYERPQREQKTNYKSSSSPSAFLHIIKSARPTRDLSHTPIISTILDKVYSTSPRTLSGATIILKETETET